jgi:hypothetical protein
LPQLESDRELREAAARLHADFLLVCTFDTKLSDTNTSPLRSMLTLGFARTKKISANSTALALLLDTHTGYIYSS